MMNERKRRPITHLPEKLNFLATNPQVAKRHCFSSIADLSEAVGWSRSTLKSAKDPNRKLLNINTNIERKFAELCQFDRSWPEWVSGSAAAFKERWLAEEASRTGYVQPEASAPITPDNLDFSSEFLQQGGAGGRHTITIHNNFSNCNITINVTSEGTASFPGAVSSNMLLDVATEHMLQTQSGEVSEARDESSALRSALKALDPHDPDLRPLRDRALFAADASDIELAKPLRSRIDAERKPAVANAEAELVNAAEAKAAWGRAALLEFAYKQAAAHFRDASDMLPGKEAKKRREYREHEARACVHQGDELYRQWCRNFRRVLSDVSKMPIHAVERERLKPGTVYLEEPAGHLISFTTNYDELMQKLRRSTRSWRLS